MKAKKQKARTFWIVKAPNYEIFEAFWNKGMALTIISELNLRKYELIKVTEQLPRKRK